MNIGILYMTQKKYHKTTMLKIDKFRKMLLDNPSKQEVQKELKLSHREYYRFLDAYKDVCYSPEAIEQRTKEDIEKISFVEHRAYKDLMTDKIKYKEYLEVNDHNLKIRTRYGLAPSEKTVIEHKHDTYNEVEVINKYMRIKSKSRPEELEDKNSV